MSTVTPRNTTDCRLAVYSTHTQLQNHSHYNQSRPRILRTPIQPLCSNAKVQVLKNNFF
ncbi:hypothetical protein HOLleu_33396 [Holothuria leucospilota]|uniref:Uncharacterized protein n=1 Tax=Holothuria leucospilota TaxID=206669 RepID=A0A9Q0YSI3_HOLLE|nr:hypothetical protein HOLleu_33396 [Holothuria leucospilota]